MTTNLDRSDSGAGKARKRVLLVHTYPLPQSIATLVTIAREKIADGALVDAFDAYPAIAGYAPDIPAKNRIIERLARKYRRFVVPEINGRDLTSSIDLSDVETPPLPETINDLRVATSSGAKVGMAALSSAASFTKIAVRDWTSEYGAPLRLSWTIAHRAAAAAVQLRTGDYDEVYIYNGRLCDTRPFCEVLDDNATVYRYEMTAAPNSYVYYPDVFHDARNVADRMSAHQANVEAGVAFYETRRRRKPGTDAHRFTDHQTRGLVPATLTGLNAPIIAMFTSSEDEYFAINDVAKFGDFTNQYEVAVTVARICARQGKVFALRLHPHLSFKSDYWEREWDFDNLKALGARIIMPHEPIDSYAVLEASQAIISCGSTIGVEAAFMERPSLMIGQHYPTELGVCPAAQTQADIEAFILRPFVLPRGREQAILMGSYHLTAGTRIPGLAHGSEPGRARFDGRIVDPPRYLIDKLKRRSRMR